MVESKFWSDKKVFITGHSGFKGSWLSLWLHNLGAQVTGYSKPVSGYQKSFFDSLETAFTSSHFGDVGDKTNLEICVRNAEPEIVFHLAAQSLVRNSILNPVETFTTNLIGTINLLEVIRKTPSVRAVVIVTSDKCYKNENLGIVFKEDGHLGGADPYSASKACAEIATDSYVQSFFSCSQSERKAVHIGTARAGNIIGGGDWGEDRLIPDLARGFMEKKSVSIRSPNAIRPWQFVLDALYGYMLLAENLFVDGDQYSGAWNFGPKLGECFSVKEVVEKFVNSNDVDLNFSALEKTDDFEMKALMIDPTKAEKYIGWRRLVTIDEAISYTRDWYLDFKKGQSPKDLCENQLNIYQDVCKV